MIVYGIYPIVKSKYKICKDKSLEKRDRLLRNLCFGGNFPFVGLLLLGNPGRGFVAQRGTTPVFLDFLGSFIVVGLDSLDQFVESGTVTGFNVGDGQARSSFSSHHTANTSLVLHRAGKNKTSSMGSTSLAMTTNWAFFFSTRVVTVLTPWWTTAFFLVGVSSLPAALASARFFKRSFLSCLVSGR